MRKKMNKRRLYYLLHLFLTLLFIMKLDAGDEKIKIFSSIDEVNHETNGMFLLIFFSTDCSVCWDDLFEMKYFVEKNNLPVQIVGVSKDTREELEQFLEKYSFYYPVINDRKGKLYKRFKVDLEPFKIILMDNEIVYKDNYYEDFSIRKEKLKKCLLKIGLELLF